jgi:hypothetical protein
MFGLGIFELLIIAVILFLLVGVPIATVIAVLMIGKRRRPPKG